MIHLIRRIPDQEPPDQENIPDSPSWENQRAALAESLAKHRNLIFMATYLHHLMSGYHTGSSLISGVKLEVWRSGDNHGCAQLACSLLLALDL